MLIPKWKGRSRDLKIAVDFAAEYEFAPIGADSSGTYGNAIHVHYTKLTRLTVRADSQYFTNGSFPTTNFGPLVTIEPAFRFVAGSRTTGASPYPPDSRQLYLETPPGSGVWVLLDEPLEDVQYGWKITLDLGYQYTGATRTQVNYLWVGTVTFWGVLGSSASSPGPMGALLHSDGAGGYLPGDRTSWRVSITAGFPGTAINDTPNDWCRTGGTCYYTSLTGTITMTLPVEERFQNIDEKVMLGTGPGVRLTSELGDNTGNVAEYPPFQRAYSEVLSPGGTHRIVVVADAGAGATTFTLTETVSASQTRLLDDYRTPIIAPYARAFALGDAGGAVTATISYSASLDLDGATVGPVSVSKSNKAGTASETACVAESPVILGRTTAPNAGAGVIEGALQTYRGNLSIGATNALLMLRPPEQLVVSGYLQRLPGLANDVPVDVVLHNHLGTALTTLTGVTGSFSHTYNYEGRNGLAVATYFDLPAPSLGSTTLQASSPWQADRSSYPNALGASITAASASATGIVRPRLCLRGRRWPLWDILHPASVLLVSGGSWPSYSVSGLTATTNTGPPATISLAAGSGAGDHRITFTLPRTSAECRYHRIRLRSVGSASQPVRVRRMTSTLAPTQHVHDWTISTGADGVWVEVLLDPLASYGGDAHVLTPLAATLVPGQWRLDIPASATVELEWIAAEASTFANLDLVRVSYEDTPSPLVSVVDGSPYGLALAPSDELANWFGSWSVSAAATPSSSKPWGHDLPWNGYVDATGPFDQSDWYDTDNVAYAAGFGLMRGAGGAPETFFNRPYIEGTFDPPLGGGGGGLGGVDPSPGGTVYPGALDAQEVLEAVQLYPGIGDVFGHSGGGYGTSTTLWFGMLLGEAVSALEVGEALESGWPDVVANKVSDGSERARGSALGDEHYGILTPDLRAGTAYTLQLDPNEGGTLSATGADRTILRTLWLVQLLQLIAMACSATQRVCRAWRAGGGVLGLEYRTIGSPDAWTAVTTSLSVGHSGDLEYDKTSETQRLIVVYEVPGGGIETRYTDDEGGTWSVATTISADGKAPACAVSPTGVRYFAWVASNQAKVKGLDSQNNVVLSTTVAVSSGVNSGGVALEHDGEVLLLTYRTTGGAISTVISADGGLTWS